MTVPLKLILTLKSSSARDQNVCLADFIWDAGVFTLYAPDKNPSGRYGKVAQVQAPG
jgi:hypothetical protein